MLMMEILTIRIFVISISIQLLMFVCGFYGFANCLNIKPI